MKNYSYLLGKSAKIVKSDLNTVYENYIMYLAPYNISGVNVCPNASPGCAAACLNLSGRGIFNNVQAGRLARTKHYLQDRISFLAELSSEIDKLAKKHKFLAIRLNGTSDLNFNPFIRKMSILYPGIIFYDYTKNINQALNSVNMDNYHVTFSRSENNWEQCIQALNAGINVSVVFKNKLPETFEGFPVVDGDITDARFLDKKGLIIGLLAKGSKAKNDNSGFVINN